MQFTNMENQDGVRFTWNVLPAAKTDVTNLLQVPFAAHYSPLRPLNELAMLSSKPVICTNTNCEAILNPYCSITSPHNDAWICSICNTRNALPVHYAQNIHQHTPPEMMPQYSTIEYIVEPAAMPNSPLSTPLVFIFIVDLCIIQEELDALKKSIIQAIMLLPENSFISLITYDRSVSLHDIIHDAPQRAFTFNGNKECTAATLSAAIALTTPAIGAQVGQQPQQPAQFGSEPIVPTSASTINSGTLHSPFLLPISQCETQLLSIIENLRPSQWPVETTVSRPIRAAGAALSVGISLLEATNLRSLNAHALLFAGDACTSNAGRIVSTNLVESIRSHRDLAKKDRKITPHYASACTYYENLAKRALKIDAVIDLFACSLDQVGVAEMRSLVELTGGNLVLDDSFTRGVFQGSLRRLFVVDPDDDNALVMAFSGKLSVRCSQSLRIQGAIGHLSSLNRAGPFVGPATLDTGIGGTYAWNLGGLDHASTACVIFSIVNPPAPAIAAVGSPSAATSSSSIIQFATRYRHSTGRIHLRVTTVAKPHVSCSTPEGLQAVRAGFDQEAAVVLLTRQCIYKTMSQGTPAATLVRYIDGILVKTIARFSSYTKGSPDSIRMSQEIAFFPQFVFYLRRSQFLQIFNSSPDETAFYHCVALKENTTNTVVMIQPTLTAYSLDGPPCPMLLDKSAISSNRILLLDTYFHIVIWYGGSIVKYRADGLHLNQEYAYLAQLLEAPVADAKEIMKRRFPTPRFIECVEGGSQARFLMAKLNPSGGSGGVDGKNVNSNVNPAGLDANATTPQGSFSEDMDLMTFLHHLKKLATNV